MDISWKLIFVSYGKREEMKTKIVFILCFLLLALPVVSFAKKEPNPNVSAEEFIKENTKTKRDQDELNKKVNKEMIAKKRAEKKAAEAEKKTDEAAKNASKNRPNPHASAYEHANENAKFKRSGDVFNNKANKEIRAKNRDEKEAVKAVEEKKKEEESHDKGEGQVKVKF
jgi:hypothetical protein